MPHQTVREAKGISWTFTGIVDLDEIRQADEEMYGDRRFDQLHYFIWDASDIDLLDIAIHSADLPAALDTSATLYKPDMKGAFVVQKPCIRTLIERYIQTSIQLGSTWHLRIFDGIREAREWATAI